MRPGGSSMLAQSLSRLVSRLVFGLGPGLLALGLVTWGLLAGGCAPRLGRPADPAPPPAAEPSGKSRFITDLELLSFESLADYDFAPHVFVDWVKRIGVRVDAQLAGDSADRTVLIQVTMHKDRDAELEIAASPPLGELRRRALTADLLQSRPPRTELTDYSVRFVATVGRGAPDRDASCTPPLTRPLTALVQRLRAASLKERVALLSTWARRDVLPVLARVMQGAPERFPGVRSVGQLLGGLDLSRVVGVAEALDHNPQYWRALSEVQAGNPLVPAARIFLHVANGELDTARLYLKPVYFFSKTDNLAHDYIELFKEFIVIFQADLDERINRGVELHDRGEYQEAINIYEGVLSEYPCSSLALYEKFFSGALLASQKQHPDAAPPDRPSDLAAQWQRYRPRVYACNPMFTMDARAGTKRESFQAARRHSIRGLFKRERDSAADWVKMADIALDIEEFGFSAHLYFLINSVLDPAQFDNRNLLSYWLYCLEKLGVTTLKAEFKGDHERDFERISDEREQLLQTGLTPAPVNRPGI